MPSSTQLLKFGWIIVIVSSSHKSLILVVAQNKRDIIELARLNHVQWIFRKERIGVEFINVGLEGHWNKIRLWIKCRLLLDVFSIYLEMILIFSMSLSFFLNYTSNLNKVKSIFLTFMLYHIEQTKAF